jgi:hypothetical protein
MWSFIERSEEAMKYGSNAVMEKKASNKERVLDFSPLSLLCS